MPESLDNPGPSARSLSFPSPVGALTLFEIGGALTAIEWGRGLEGDGSPLLDEARRQLDAYFDGKLKDFDLPLDLDGSPFQVAVWRAMTEIPYGETRTYGELADGVGGVARAVGTACGDNPIPIIVPCHRVVGAGGKLTGYSGGEGVETKRFLLRLEGAEPGGPTFL